MRRLETELWVAAFVVAIVCMFAWRVNAQGNQELPPVTTPLTCEQKLQGEAEELAACRAALDEIRRLEVWGCPGLTPEGLEALSCEPMAVPEPPLVQMVLVGLGAVLVVARYRCTDSGTQTALRH